MYALSEQDYRLFREMVQAHQRSRSNGSQVGIGGQIQEDFQASDVYVARTPSGGIPALSAGGDTGTGTGSPLLDDVPGSAMCQIYTIQDLNGSYNIPPIPGLYRRVFNVAATAISGDTWIIIKKTKRGFWVAETDSSTTTLDWEEVEPDLGYAITADSTWEDTGYSITVPAGTHLIFGLASGSARVSATPPGSISIRLYNVTAASPIPSVNYQAVITTAAVVNMTFNGTATIIQFVTLAVASEIRLEAIRGAGPTWSESAVGTSARAINLGYLTVG
jgi:hypothetical protein